MTKNAKFQKINFWLHCGIKDWASSVSLTGQAKYFAKKVKNNYFSKIPLVPKRS
jgi:hypothetical protein